MKMTDELRKKLILNADENLAHLQKKIKNLRKQLKLQDEKKVTVSIYMASLIIKGVENELSQIETIH